TESRSSEYLRINPNGHIPSLEDDGFVLWESLAINMYLAETYAGVPLWPAGAKDHALVYQRSLWAANEIEPCIVSIAKGLSKWAPDPRAVVLEFRAALRRPWHTGKTGWSGHISSATTSWSMISILPRPFASPERRASLESPRWILFLSQMPGAGSLQCAACKSSRS